MAEKPPKMINDLSGLIERLVWRVFKEKRALDKALVQYQAGYVENGLRSLRIQEARIPGVAPLVKDRLSEHGLYTAQDIRSDSLLTIKGLGVATVRNLLAWRFAEEQVLRATIPRTLPAEEMELVKAYPRSFRQHKALAQAPVAAPPETGLVVPRSPSSGD